MPTPMTPNKPTLPGNATPDQDTANMSPADKLKAGLQGGTKAVGMTAVQRLAAIAQGKNPDAQALGPAQGEKAFVVKTQKDPNGSIHVYAKNENEAKQKYQQLGNPLGNALAAQEVKEERSDDPDYDEDLKRFKKGLPPKKRSMAEGGFDNASPMTKDSIRKDKIRSLKNLISIAKEQGRRLKVQELELELKKLESVDEARKANTASARAELGKRERKVDPVEQDKKKKESDEAWALLQRHMADKKQGVAEGDVVPFKKPAKQNPHIPGYVASGSTYFMDKYGKRAIQKLGIKIISVGGPNNDADAADKSAQEYGHDADVREYYIDATPEQVQKLDAALYQAADMSGDEEAYGGTYPANDFNAMNEGEREFNVGITGTNNRAQSAYYPDKKPVSKPYGSTKKYAEQVAKSMIARGWKNVSDMSDYELGTVVGDTLKQFTNNGSTMVHLMNHDKDFLPLVKRNIEHFSKQGVAEDFASRLGKAYDSGASALGWKYEKDAPKWNADAEEKKPFSNYRKGWIQHNDRFGLGAEERKQTSASKFKEPQGSTSSKKNGRGQQAFHIATLKDRVGNTVIMAKSPEEAKAEWERKYGMTGDRIIKVMTAQEANIGESMTTTTLKTTFEGLEDTIAGLLEEYGLENGRDFYIDGTIRTVSEQVAQDILSVLSDFELPGQTNMRKLDEQYNISLIGQGEEPVESLRIGSDSVDIKHIGEGFVRVYVNNELAETFDNGSAAFKYVKALQENLAEAEQEIISAMTAEAGEDLMKISNITEGWDDMLKDVKDRSGPQPNGGSGIKKGKRYGGADQNDDEKAEAPKDADGNPVKRGRGRPKKVREGLDSIRKMRQQVAEALARIERLPEDQRNSVRVQSVVQALEESVRTAIKKAM